LTCISKCSSNLTLSFLSVCEIITIKVDEKFLKLFPRGTSKFWKPKQPFLRKIWILGLHVLIPSWVRHDLLPTRGVEHWGKTIFYKGYAEIHIQWWFSKNKEDISEFFYRIFKWWAHPLMPPLYTFLNFYYVFCGKSSKSQFLVVFDRFG
jgi:hypothetical protein